MRLARQITCHSFLVISNGYPVGRTCVFMSPLLFTLVFFVSGCQEKVPTRLTEKWQQKEEEVLRSCRQHLGPNTRIHLSASCVDSYNGGVILLGGSYRDPAGSYRSALLISMDGGRSWRDTNTWLVGSEVIRIYWLDSERAWMMTCWSIEGGQAPYHVFGTTDGGRNWKRLSEALPEHIETSLCWPIDFSFANALDGQVTFRSTLGDVCTYKTVDGGINWTLVERRKRNDGEEEKAGPASPHSRRKNLYKAETDWRSGIIKIMKQNVGEGTWSIIGILPYYYRLEGIEVAPRKGDP